MSVDPANWLREDRYLTGVEARDCPGKLHDVPPPSNE
jgi:hypothetical protein